MTTENLLSQIEDVLQHEIAQRHSYFQLKYFVIGKEPTNQAKMWACLRELKSRHDSLKAIDLEIEEAKDGAELLDIAITKAEKQKEESRECEIRVRQLQRKKSAAAEGLVRLGEKKKWLLEESNFFVSTFKNLEKIEPLKPYDDVDSQKQFWGEKLSQKLNLKMLSSNQLDMELVETIVALPDDIPIKKQALNMLSVRHNHMVQALSSTAAKMIEGKNGN